MLLLNSGVIICYIISRYVNLFTSCGCVSCHCYRVWDFRFTQH